MKAEPTVFLTRRELDVAEKLSEGKADKVIKDELGIAHGTLRIYIKSLLLKFRCDNRTRIVIEYMRFLSKQK